MSFSILSRPPLTALLLIASLVGAPAARAAAVIRHFEFGESDLNLSGLPAQIGDVVVSTHNRLGEMLLPDNPTQMDLFPIAGTSPVYVEGRNGPGSLAVAFDGSLDESGFATQLVGKNFCTFCITDTDVREVLLSASDGQQSGTSNRGFQAWLKPDPAGIGLAQLAIADGGEAFGGVGITPEGNWLHISISTFGTREETDTGVPVAFGQWTHVAEIALGNTAGLYVNGVLVDTRDLDFGIGAPIGPLTVGTRNDGQSDPFIGAVDDLKLILPSAPVGLFNPRLDLDFFENIVFSGVEGDINQDGIIDQADFDIWAQNVGQKLELGFFSTRPQLIGQVYGGNPGALLLGDANENGIIDLADFSLIKHAAMAQGNLVIPEPGTLAVLGLGMLALARRRVARVRVRSSVRF